MVLKIDGFILTYQTLISYLFNFIYGSDDKVVFHNYFKEFYLANLTIAFHQDNILIANTKFIGNHLILDQYIVLLLNYILINRKLADL